MIVWAVMFVEIFRLANFNPFKMVRFNFVRATEAVPSASDIFSQILLNNIVKKTIISYICF